MKTLSLNLSFALVACVATLSACTRPAGDDVGADGTQDNPGNNLPTSDTDAGMSATPDLSSPGVPCPPGAKTGSSSGTSSFSSPMGTAIIVRTPATYDPQTPSPLIVVYAAANRTAADMETRTALTSPATARGYLIAYVDHLSPASDADIQEAADSAKAVQDSWCVDSKRIFLTGHSDGGSMTHLVTLEELLEPAAIAPSASGLSTSTLNGVQCPLRHTPLLEMHSIDDTLFPVSQGFGADVAKWFAACSSCSATPSGPDSSGCVVYSGCMAGAEVRYCEGTGKHGTWPTFRDPAVLDFFDRFHLP